MLSYRRLSFGIARKEKKTVDTGKVFGALLTEDFSDLLPHHLINLFFAGQFNYPLLYGWFLVVLITAEFRIYWRGAIVSFISGLAMDWFLYAEQINGLVSIW